MSCKNQKAITHTTSQVQTQHYNHSQTHSDSTHITTATTQTKDSTHIEQTITQHTQTTYFSEPDSLGRQYAISTTNTTTTIHYGQQNHIDTNICYRDTTQNNQQTHSYQLAEQQQQSQTDSTLTTKTETPAWFICLIIAIITAAVIIVLIILKHYRLI